MLLTYFLNDFEIVPVAPIITGITLVFTFHMRCIYYYYYYYYYYHHHHHHHHHHEKDPNGFLALFTTGVRNTDKIVEIPFTGQWNFTKRLKKERRINQGN